MRRIRIETREIDGCDVCHNLDFDLERNVFFCTLCGALRNHKWKNGNITTIGGIPDKCPLPDAAEKEQ